MLRLVSSNLLHGRSIVDGQVNTQRYIRALSELKPTVLAMQEVDRFQPRGDDTDQTAQIAAAIPGSSWRFVPAIIGVPGEQWRPATAHDAASGHDLPQVDASIPTYGTGLITTLPVKSWHVIRVQPFRFRAPVFIPGIDKWMLIDDEPRVCIAAVVEIEGTLMTVAGTHASFVPGWNIPQIRQITRALRTLPGPHILLGDLNLPAPVPAWVTRWKALATGLPTFPASNPKMQLDHALLHDPAHTFNRENQPIAARVEHLPFSDHRALVVEIG